MAGKDRHTPSMSTVSLAVLVLVTFFTALYMKGLNSGIPFYYDSLGYSATVGGTFVAVFTLASTAMRLIGGQFTDHFPHYRVLLASLAGLFVGVIIPAFCDAFWVVMASRVIQGASFALATNVMTVAVMGSADVKHIGKRVGIKGAGTSLGTMLGALVSTWLLDDVGHGGFYLFYAGIIVAGIVAIVILHHAEKRHDAKEAEADNAGPGGSGDAASGAKTTAGTVGAEGTKPGAAPDTNAAGTPAAASTAKTQAAAEPATTPTQASAAQSAAKPPLKKRLRDILGPYFIPSVMPLMAVSFARRMPKGFCIAFILVFAKYSDIGMGAAFFVAAGATTLLCRLGGGKLFDSGRVWLLLPLISTQIVGFAILCLWPSFATLLVAAVCYGISVGTTSPFIKTLTAKATPKEHWGVVNGELYFFGDMGKAVGAFAGGLIIDATSKSFVPEIALGIAAITAVFTAIALVAYYREKRRDATPAA